MVKEHSATVKKEKSYSKLFIQKWLKWSENKSSLISSPRGGGGGRRGGGGRGGRRGPRGPRGPPDGLVDALVEANAVVEWFVEVFTVQVIYSDRYLCWAKIFDY